MLRHGRGSAWHRALLRRLAAEQLLLASSTTEGQAAATSATAPLRSSAGRPHHARPQRDRDLLRRHADGIVTTARRAPDAAASDQVLSCSSRRTIRSSALSAGTRSACAAPAAPASSSKARVEPSRSCPEAYEQIHAQTMMPVAHLTWSAAWAGIAAGAVDRARAFVRKAARRATASCRRAPRISRAPAPRCARCASVIAAALQRFEARRARARRWNRSTSRPRMNLLKVQRLGACGRDRDERDAGLRACPAIATTANSASAAICATCCRRRS